MQNIEKESHQLNIDELQIAVALERLTDWQEVKAELLRQNLKKCYASIFYFH